MKAGFVPSDDSSRIQETLFLDPQFVVIDLPNIAVTATSTGFDLGITIPQWAVIRSIQAIAQTSMGTSPTTGFGIGYDGSTSTQKAYGNSGAVGGLDMNATVTTRTTDLLSAGSRSLKMYPYTGTDIAGSLSGTVQVRVVYEAVPYTPYTYTDPP